jgi:hypothetical protein
VNKLFNLVRHFAVPLPGFVWKERALRAVLDTYFRSHVFNMYLKVKAEDEKIELKFN